MSIMDFEKVNLELIEALLEWIVDGKHSYPPGNCFLSSFMCKMAKGKELTSWDHGHHLPSWSPHPTPGRLFKEKFYLLPFEVHPLFLLCTVVLTKQKDVNNSKSQRKKTKKKAWMIHCYPLRPWLKGSLVVSVWISWRLCTPRPKGTGVKRTALESDKHPSSTTQELHNLG